MTARPGPDDSVPGAPERPERDMRPGPQRESWDKRRSIVGGIVAGVFLVVVFSRVVPQVGDYQGAVESLKNMDLQSAVALAACLTLYLWLYGWPFVAATVGLRYWQGFVVNQSSFAISNGIPAGGPVALAVQMAQLTSYRVLPTAATSAVGAVGIWSALVSLGVPVLGAFAFLAAGQDLEAFLLPILLALLALAGVLGGFTLLLRSDAWALRLGRWGDSAAGWLLPRIRPGWRVDITGAALKLRRDTVDLVTARWRSITVTSLAVSAGQCLMLLIALRGVSEAGSSVPYLAAAGAWAISQLGMMVPITPGGLGTVDAALISLLVSAGVDAGTATAATLLWRACLYFPQLLVGLVCLGVWRWQRRSSRTAA